MVKAVVDHGTLAINMVIEQWGWINDLSFFQGNYYAAKAPGVALAGVPVYFLAKKVASIFDLSISHRALVILLRISIIIIPSLIFITLFFRFLVMEMKLDGQTSLLAVLLYSLGTISFTYSTTYVNHSLVSILIYTAFWAILKQRWFWAGFGCGLAFLCEYPAILAAGILGLFIISRPRPSFAEILSRSFKFSLGFLPGLLAFFLINYLMFNNSLSTPYSHLHNPYHVHVHSQGFFSLTIPAWDRFLGICFSSFRGIFFISPALLFFLPGLWVMAKNGKKKEGWLSLVMVMIYFLYNSSLINWQGGWSTGPRYIVLVIPWMVTAIAFWIQPRAIPAILAPARFLAISLLLSSILVSILLCTWSTLHFPFFSPQIKNPFYDLLLPLWQHDLFPFSLAHLLGIKGTGATVAPIIVLLIIFIFIVSLPIIRFYQFNRNHGLEKERSSFLLGGSKLVWRFIALILTITFFVLHLYAYSHISRGKGGEETVRMMKLPGW